MTAPYGGEAHLARQRDGRLEVKLVDPIVQQQAVRGARGRLGQEWLR